MRALTESEARVIAVMLAARPDRERERLHQVQVPRSTYHAVRRRAYEESWLRDRYIPHPVPIGRPYVTFILLRPYADRFEEFAALAAADPGNVALWTGTQVALAIFFQAKPTEAKAWTTRIAAQRLGANPLMISVRGDGPTVPVYFDFEGLWCHLVGLSGTLAYPHGLGGPIPEEEAGPLLTPHRRWAISELLNRPFLAAEDGRGSHLVGPFGLPFAQRRMLARGWVDHRTLLDPSRLPAYQGKSPDQVVLLSGAPRAGARPEVLFSTLTRECRVYPFLLVVGDDRWLVGALGAASPPPESTASRRPVLATFREYLEGIEVIQEPADRFVARVDHRYDRLLPPKADGASAKA
ncbi:MAG TPA: hypothetical protein VMI55_05980 [Thermoplasmata archaeon]|nr:hypothetical protein [Thermoplasmata archaeon]